MKYVFSFLLMCVVCLITASASAQVGVLPPGYIGAIQCCNTPGQYSSYSYTFTPSVTGSDYVLFAFRQDPAYWSFGNVRVTLAGSTTNLLANGNMQYGGSVTVTTNNGQQQIQAPTHWGVVYQNGIYPAAAGFWSGSGGPQGVGQWYDGAVGSFDGIYQGISVSAGQTYTVSFQALSTYGVANTSSIQIGVYAGGCANLGLSPANCQTPTSSGWTSLATPAQTGTAGGVTVVSTSTTNTTSTTTTYGTPVVTTTYPTRTVNAVVNGQAVIETFTDTQTSTVTPVITTTYSTPTTVTTYSDGTVVTTTGTATVISTSTTNSSPVIALTQATIPTSIVPAYSSNITPAQQARYDASQVSIMSISRNSIDINNQGNNNQILIQQVGTTNQVKGVGTTSAPIQGNSNQLVIRQGDIYTRTGPNLAEVSVSGDYNTTQINQGRDQNGNSLGSDTGGHYATTTVFGSSNQVTISQVGNGHYAEATVTGSTNTASIVQTGTKNQAFTATVGNYNTMAISQAGSNNYADVSMNGPGNNVTLTQTNGGNKSTISLTNAGGPASVNVTQTGQGTFSINQTCVTAGGCAATVIRQ